MKIPFDNFFRRIFQSRQPRIIKTAEKMPPWIRAFQAWFYLPVLAALTLLILQAGMRLSLPRFVILISSVIDLIVIAGFIIQLVLLASRSFLRIDFFRRQAIDILIILIFIMQLISLKTLTGLVVLLSLMRLLVTFTQTPRFSRLLRRVRLNTPQIVLVSFLGTILIGTLLLTFPIATADGKGATLVDALFTATSATCVTGLIVQDTPTYFSTFGQLVILTLIQLGGLGIMTYSAFVALLIGKFGLGQRKILQEMFEEERNIFQMIFYIFKMTVIIELVGMLLLFSRWIFRFHEVGKTLYFSLFHSISAFCNAGFSLFSDSLQGFVNDPAVNLIIMALILIGGIGFLVVADLTKKRGRVYHRLSSHSRLVLITSASLIVLGFFIVFFFEFDTSLHGLSLGGKLWAALFQSVTPRTAGFNTIPIAAMNQITLTVLMMLMFIGASPGSTGGGIKTSTFAVLILSLRSMLRNRGQVEVFNRTIPAQAVLKVVALLVCALVLILTIFSLLLTTEDKPFLPLLFETISAFGTVGLSMGVTPELTVKGKLFISLLMYLGRIGPLTFALALAGRVRYSKIRYPETKIMLG